MRITRLAAALAAASVVALTGAASASAAAAPQASIGPSVIKPGGALTATLTGCEADAASVKSDLLDGGAADLEKGTDAGTFAGKFNTVAGAKLGAHAVTVLCGEDALESAKVTVADFDASITPNPFHDGDTLTLKTTGCPTGVPTVDDVDGLFTGPLVLKATGDFTAQGSAKTKSVLPKNKVFRIVVTCKGVEKITFSTEVGKPTTKKPGGQTGVTPVGGVQTGDGSSLRDNSTPVLPIVAGGGAVVLAAGLGLAYRRRKAQEDA